MREILFRGYCENLKKWVFGNYVKAEKLNIKGEYEYFIIEVANDGTQFEVLPETVGQSTGVVDKNKVEIFEGDRIRFMDEFMDEGEEGYEYKEAFEYENEATVSFDDERMGWDLADFKECSEFAFNVDTYDFYANFEYFEIIGNIHDNPELKGELEK